MEKNKNKTGSPPAAPQLRRERGITILSSGEELTLDQVNRTLEEVRRERDAEILGHEASEMWTDKKAKRIKGS